jgi:serine protease inhibitor
MALWLLVLMTALVGCQRQPKRTPPVPPPQFPKALPLFRPTTADRQSLPAIVRANNAFALALYEKLRARPGNLLVSPACLFAGLALARTGARGETSREMLHVMHLPESMADRDHALAALIQDLNADAEDRSFQIRLANALWVQEGYPLLDTYRDRLKDVFAVNPTPVFPSGRPEQACRVINEWTASRTGGRIVAALHPGDLPHRTRLILTCALYLRANWLRRFRRELTVQETFHVSPFEGVSVPMMNEHSYSIVDGYLDGGSFQALEMPCGSNGEFSAVLLLPRQNDGVSKLEEALTPDALDSWWPKFRRPEEIIVAVPKFRVRADVSLDDLLAELGMPLAFQDEADFSGVNGESQDLFLAAVRHSTFLDFHEEGIEAAAAMSIVSPDAFGEEPAVFRADHPFVYLIRDTRTGCIVFLGRIINPLNESFSNSRSDRRE